jgi:hypothetical protein
MIQKNKNQSMVFSGNVIEIYNNHDLRCLKILFKPECIQTNIKSLDDFHLGDDVDVYCDIKVKEVKPVIGTVEKGER